MQGELLFKNPVFNKGLNVTIRNGKKWLKAQPGDYMRLVNTEDGSIVNHGTVLFTTHMHYKDISKHWLSFEYDPKCKTLQGLKTEMNKVYGEDKWGPDVTVLFFMV